REDIASRGRERGFVTSDELLDVLPQAGLDDVQVEEFIAGIETSLREQGIDVVDAEAAGDSEPAGDGDGRAGDDRPDGLPPAVPARVVNFDPVRMYIGDIGRAPLLTASQEVDLAMRIEAGRAADELLSWAGPE